MQKLRLWLLFSIILLSTCTFQVTYSAHATSDTPLSKVSSNSPNYTAILTNITFDHGFYQNKIILLNGTVSIIYSMSIYNCSIYYSSQAGKSGFSLLDGASMIVGNSRFYPLDLNAHFTINGTQDNILSITNSIIIGNSDSNSSIIQFTNSTDIYISNSTFLNSSSLATITKSKNVIFISNNVTNFKTALIFEDNSSNVLITKNYFKQGLTAFVFTDFNFTDNFNCNFNDFLESQNILFIYNFSRSQFIDGPIINNYYSQDTGIDFNNDGFYDQPFTTSFFIDRYPLSYSFDNYYIINNQVVLRINYNENSLVHNSPNFIHVGREWYFLFLFYTIISCLPIIILFKLNRRKKKV